jgi:hypothetical protein
LFSGPSPPPWGPLGRVPGGGPPVRAGPRPAGLGYDGRVSDYFDLQAAQAMLPELREKLEHLRALRAEIVSLRNGIVALRPEPVSGAAAAGGSTAPPGLTPEVEEKGRILHLRLQGVFDQMQAAVLEMDGLGIQLRDIEAGLVDFPALVSGRPVWLCWQLGEDSIGWWHEYDRGFASRRRIEDLV